MTPGKKIELNKVLRNAGIATAVGLSVIALVTGLSLGLKRGGKDVERNAVTNWKKLTPAEKREQIIPWFKIQEAGGKGIVEIGNYFPVIIAGSVVYVIVKKI